MKKIFTLAIGALLCVGASAKQLVCDLSALPATSENTTWDAATNTFAWSASSYNSMQVFPAGDYSAYTTLNYVAEAGLTDHFRIIFKFSNGAGQVTFTPAPVGTKSYTWAEMGVGIDNVPFISTIRISGTGYDGTEVPSSIKLTSLFLEGPDVVTYDPIKIYAQDWAPINSVTNFNVQYPFVFKEGGSFWGSDANSSTPNQDVTGYSNINIVVGSTGGGQVRAFLWNDATSEREIVYFHKVGGSESDTNISTSGVYTASLGSCTKLLGIKWNWGCNNVSVEAAFLSKSTDTDAAVNEARTLSSTKILDFSEVTDVEAYIATAVTNGVLTMKKVTGAVPANTGLVLKQFNEKSVISIPTCGTATEDVSGNLLVATTAPTTVPVGSYALAGKGEELGWYSVGASVPTLAAGKCYLTVPAAAAGTHFVMDFESEEGMANSIEQVEAVANGIFYTLQGAKVEAPQKGSIYVVNGKKVIY